MITQEDAVPLSRDEQRALDEIERALLDGDPELARRIKRPSRKRSILRPSVTLIALLAGLTLIAIGLLAPGPAQIAGAVIGFALVVGSCWRTTLLLARREWRSRPS
jgi:hypothetical protein